ncbi:Zinc carboxypeptidase-related protein [Candidatus Burkholderia verschuerenii]|uniref:Zinc carboxypeptidase-related protein n=1 Tax=Candidatus Burkholderia verschuerenii TaxID=242163 RepID=A0A0L0M8K4_9BURK|nr:M14 family zinc carboxypeptidase [Candidatus Burkholderia verschuerenii]KND58294.1 Zinc carboxypeptidase-related protein [Candidatus Burkholderia verschuerenii]
MSTLRVASETFPEMDELKAILVAGGTWFERRTICEVQADRHSFPILTASIGSTDRNAPAVGFFGGVHGLECIGTQLVLEYKYMRALLRRLEWDELLRDQLRTIRLVFMPIVNHGGMAARRRSNPNGVDLMRNAPQSAEGRVPFLAGGQRIGPWLPWYRGASGANMEAESAALLSVVDEELMSRPLSFALDCHSGFGWNDSIWFPYARTEREMAHLPEMFLLKTMFEESYPHHGYAFEPQSHQYLLHGDLWDCAYDRTRAPNIFLPMTLELGSWRWIRKNPMQLFSRLGIFNPIKAHRTRRVLRRHPSFFDFLTRAAFSSCRWLPDGEFREQVMRRARDHWKPADAT